MKLPSVGGRLIERRVGVAGEQVVRLEGGELRQHRREVLGAGLEIFRDGLDALGLEERFVDLAQHLSALVVLEQHGDLLGASRLDQIVDHPLPKPVGTGIPVPSSNDEVMIRSADEIVHARCAAHQQELAVELLGVGQDRYEHVGKKRAIHETRFILLEQSLQLDCRFLRVATSIEGDEFDLWVLSPTLKPPALLISSTAIGTPCDPIQP